jgi:trk system potassium uptake protein TrkA
MNILIVGGGKIGAYITKLLVETNVNVTVIESRESRREVFLEYIKGENIIIGDATNPEVIESANVGDIDTAVIVTGDDQTNLLISTIAKGEFGIPRIIAKVNNLKNEWLFDSTMGVDIKFNQADVLAHLIAEEINIKNMVMLLKLHNSDYSIVQLYVEPGATADGKLVCDLSIPEDIVLIALERQDNLIIPRGNVEIHGGDHILAMAQTPGIAALNELFLKNH